MIAYIDSSQHLSISNNEGNDTKRVDAPGTTHTWPTWAPDGKRLTFSSLISGSNGTGRMGLFVHDLENSSSELWYENERGSDAISPGIIHYALWSPNALKLALVTGTLKSGLTLLVLNTSQPEKPVELIHGGPLFISWSPDSQFLLIHRESEHHLVDFRNDINVAKIPGRSRLYMSPSWSPKSNRMAIMRETGNRQQSILAGKIPDGDVSLVSEFEGSSAFAWSPDGEFICVARSQIPKTRFYTHLWLEHINGIDKTMLSEDRVLAFYWSPNGKKIAYITVSEDVKESYLRWAVVDIGTKVIKYYTDFQPTDAQLTSFIYFDQYVQSHNPWSGDSRELLFCGSIDIDNLDDENKDNGEARVMVLNLDDDRTPTSSTSGAQATWSP